jgi:hypothetical protein
MNRYLVPNIMMNDGEKRRPIFLFQYNSSCKEEMSETALLKEVLVNDIRKISKEHPRDEHRKATSCCSVFPPFDFLHTEEQGLTPKININ